jgi:hypothetical protein
MVLLHKNINKTLISQNSCDDFLAELQMGDKDCNGVGSLSELRVKLTALFRFCKSD